MSKPYKGYLASPVGQAIYAKSEIHRRAMEAVSKAQNSAMELGSMTLQKKFAKDFFN